MDRRGQADRWLLGAVGLLVGLGLVFLYSSSAWVSERATDSAHRMLLNQAVKAVVGIALLVGLGQLDYRRLAGRWAWVAWGGTTLLLLYLALPHPWKESIRHTDRWIRVGPMSVQPSEFARVAMIVSMSALIANRVHWPRGTERKEWAIVAALAVVPIGLVLSQPNFGTAMAMGASALALLVLAGIPWRVLAPSGASLVGVAALLTLRFSYPLERIRSWWAGVQDFDALQFQIKQGVIALGSGGLTGVGLGRSLQKRQFVPDPHTDLILAIIGEEVGFIGVLVLLALFAIVLWRGLRIAARAPDTFGYLLAAGLTVQIGLYFVLNAAVVTGLMPVTGLPLPFVSYGGSALIANLAAVGVLLSVSRAASWSRRPVTQRVVHVGVRP